MTEYLFNHDRLDVYRLSIDYVANAFETSRPLSGLYHRDFIAMHVINGCTLHNLSRLILRKVMENVV
jgi:hypothetical protein